MQEDIQNRVEDRGGDEEPIYRSIETQTKLEKRSLEDFKLRLEADLEYLKEKLIELNGETLDQSELKLFGSDFFSTYQSTYMPINEPNLSPSYILDFGDILEIQLAGQKNETDTYKVKRDGSINLPDIGPISVGGLSLTDATQIVKSKVNTTYIGTEALLHWLVLEILMCWFLVEHTIQAFTLSVVIQTYCMFWVLLEALMNMVAIEKLT